MVTWALLLPLLVAVAQAQVCSVEKNSFEVSENTSPGQLLLNITVPEGQQVTLGPSPTRFAFRIQGTQLFLNVTPDYEENSMLEAVLECKRDDTVVTSLRVFVSVLDVNDNPPRFPFVVKVQRVPEDTKVNAVVIPETELKAQDLDKDDVLFYTLQEATPGASGFFSLVGANRPELRLDRSLDFDRWPNMTFQLLVRVSRPLPPSSRTPTAPPEPLQPQAPRPDGRAAVLQDTREENVEPSHTATATLVLEVRPADLRAPWFLPCTYSDGFVCVEAQYHGAVPTGHTLSGPLILHPGPIYAVDGDRGIHQPIVYSIIRGNEDGSFSIDANTGNLTMTKSIPSPKTFLLLVKGEQADHARYSVTQVTVEAQAASGSPPRFPQSLYRGTVALGSGVGVAIKDAAAPSQALRIRAQDPEFPDLNSAITYRVTNNSNFRMDGEAMLTDASLVHAGVFYAEVEARNTVTSGTATTVVEVQVSEQEPAPTGPPPSPETAGTTGASSGTTSEAPRPPEPSWGSSTTSSGGDSSPRPSSGTTLRPPASSMPGGPPSAGTSPSSPSASPSGGSAQTSKPGTSLPMSPGPSRTTRPTGLACSSGVPSLPQAGPGVLAVGQQAGSGVASRDAWDRRKQPASGWQARRKPLLGGGYGGAGRGAERAAPSGSHRPHSPRPQALRPPTQVLLWQSAGEALGVGERTGERTGGGGEAAGWRERQRGGRESIREMQGRGEEGRGIHTIAHRWGEGQREAERLATCLWGNRGGLSPGLVWLIAGSRLPPRSPSPKALTTRPSSTTPTRPAGRRLLAPHPVPSRRLPQSLHPQNPSPPARRPSAESPSPLRWPWMGTARPL
ncbi:cadherin-related family member 5 isoform X3 [Globicephala melas]|uniref:cadherin-related family member 5 isoform X3 n=1 Tax=Globicephala melas TaxID=9731 RepID=UPI00293D4155|nr:cadherin-related family member 5 isoform X3 [Globicephala melas]